MFSTIDETDLSRAEIGDRLHRSVCEEILWKILVAKGFQEGEEFWSSDWVGEEALLAYCHRILLVVYILRELLCGRTPTTSQLNDQDNLRGENMVL